MLSVSNIAWSPEEELEALFMLRGFEIHNLEVAPGRIWPAIGDTPLDAVRGGMSFLTEACFGISGFQAILFGKPELVLFEEVGRQNLLAYLKRLAVVCSEAGGKYLVFGAPKNRWVPEGLDPQNAFEMAVDFFKDLGAFAENLGVSFGMEANPASYGCNFCTHVADVARLVRAVDSAGMRWHLDTGELAMNSEALPGTILENADLIGSMHVSQAELGDFSAPWAGHSAVASALRELGYAGPVSLEMKRPGDGLEGVRQAVEFLVETYAS